MRWKVYFITASLICIIVSCIITGNICYSAGYEQGSEDWYDLGSAEGFLSGYECGREEGYQSGVEDGYQNGLGDGYKGGYDDGRFDSDEYLRQSNAAFIGSRASRIFHRLTCSALPDPEYRIYFSSRGEACRKCYSPCDVCKP